MVELGVHLRFHEGIGRQARQEGAALIGGHFGEDHLFPQRIQVIPIFVGNEPFDVVEKLMNWCGGLRPSKETGKTTAAFSVQVFSNGSASRDPVGNFQLQPWHLLQQPLVQHPFYNRLMLVGDLGLRIVDCSPHLFDGLKSNQGTGEDHTTGGGFCADAEQSSLFRSRCGALFRTSSNVVDLLFDCFDLPLVGGYLVAFGSIKRESLLPTKLVCLVIQPLHLCVNSGFPVLCEQIHLPGLLEQGIVALSFFGSELRASGLSGTPSL